MGVDAVPQDDCRRWLDINVYIDGALVGPVIYSQYRSDIATLFPGLANSAGPIAYRAIDTTKYANGLHTISWAVTDSAGVREGFWSRYFRIENGNGATSSPVVSAFRRTLDRASGKVRLKPDTTEPVRDDDRGFVVRARELERVEIDLGARVETGYLVVGDERRPLPIGSTLDLERGVFRWQPGPGFVGSYELRFVRSTGSGGRESVAVRMVLEEPQQ